MNDLVRQQPIDHFAMTGGMNTKAATQLLADNQWILAKNVLFDGDCVKQVPPLWLVGSVDTTQRVDTLVSLPAGRDASYWIALTPTAVYALKRGTSMILSTLLTNTGVTPSRYTGVLDLPFTSVDEPWATCVHNGHLFFTNTHNRVRICNGFDVFDVWEDFWCEAVDAHTVDADLKEAGYEIGPFTNHPLWVGEPGGALSGGLLHPIFNWAYDAAHGDPARLFFVDDSYYRVYVKDTKMFPIGATVRIYKTYPLYSERFLTAMLADPTYDPYDGGTTLKVTGWQYSLRGVVIAKADKYLVLEAIEPVESVDNRTIDESWTDVAFANPKVPTLQQDGTMSAVDTDVAARLWDNSAPYIVHVTKVPDVPAGRYVAVFFDHLVVAGQLRDPAIVQWSGLRNYMDWVPSTSCEADSYHCVEYQRGDDLVQGVTGLQHFKEVLLVFTPSCIYAMHYTGLPKVVRVEPLVIDFGNGLPYASAALDDRVVWCDVHHRSFLAWRGQGVEDFGGPIADYFFTHLSSTTAYAIKTRVFVDRARHEVSWWYIKDAATALSEAVVYDWVANAWSVRAIDANQVCFCRFHKRARTNGELSGANELLSGTNEALSESGEALDTVYGTSTGQVLHEESSVVTPAGRLGNVLETGDLIYGSATRVKEVHTISLHVSGTLGATGIKVEVSARERIADTVSYGDPVGYWTNSLSTKHLTFRARAGKVLRYRFTLPNDARNVVFYGYSDNIANADATR